MKRKNNLKMTEVVIGLFCFMLFFIINPNGLVSLTSTYKVFFLNIFLFVPYLVLAHNITKNAVGVKKIPAIAATATIATEFILVQLSTISNGKFQLDPSGDIMATLNLAVFLLFLTEFLTRKIDERNK